MLCDLFVLYTAIDWSNDYILFFLSSMSAFHNNFFRVFPYLCSHIFRILLNNRTLADTAIYVIVTVLVLFQCGLT